MLTNSELKMLRRMEDKERWKVPAYIVFGIGFFIGVFFLSIGIILNESDLKILGLISGLPTIIGILAIREQLKLYRIIKKLQAELEENQKKNSTETH